MSVQVKAVVQTGAEALELRELKAPEIGPNEALVRVEACGICGTDIDRYYGRWNRNPPYPLIPGHEAVGTIEAIGLAAARDRGLREGDRVAIDTFVSCGLCRYCLRGDREQCVQPDNLGYGRTSLDQPPGLWGGYATHLYVHPRTVLFSVPGGVPADLAVLYNPLAAGIKWGVMLSGVGLGSSLVILGAGQRGLACLLAARSAGAITVVITDLNDEKLALARDLGAAVTVNPAKQDLEAAVLDATGGEGADAVVDTTPALQSLVDSLAIVRPAGTVVVAGLKIDNTPVSVPPLAIDQARSRGLTIRGARGVGSEAYRRALELIGTGTLPLERLRTHTFGLADAAQAIKVLAGKVPGKTAINVVISPDFEPDKHPQTSASALSIS
jgi:2-desacetyl-2-hydroxyethyl bacteriochlorophyllide A dehydrogenase